MLSLFPQILFLAPLGLTLIRVSAGITFLWLAYWHGSREHELRSVRFPVVGRGAWIVWVSVAWEVAVGAALIVGFYAQLAALLGALSAVKFLLWRTRYPQFIPLARQTSVLLLAICLSLLVSGAGAYAFDLPL